jgi:ribonuclease P protein component
VGPSKARFEEIFAKGKRASGPLARIAALPGTGLVGFATPRKLGNRPRRNRARRRFAEAIRLQPGLVDSRLDFVLIVSADGADAPFERIQEEVRTLFERARSRWDEELGSS